MAKSRQRSFWECSPLASAPDGTFQTAGMRAFGATSPTGSAGSILTEIARCMSVGECREQLKHFHFPHPIFFGEDVRVVMTPSDAAEGTKAYLSDLSANGVEKISAKIEKVISEGEGRCRLQVAWIYADASGRIVSSSLNDIYFNRDTDGRLKIGQIEIHASSNNWLRRSLRLGGEVGNS